MRGFKRLRVRFALLSVSLAGLLATLALAVPQVAQALTPAPCTWNRSGHYIKCDYYASMSGYVELSNHSAASAYASYAGDVDYWVYCNSSGCGWDRVASRDTGGIGGGESSSPPIAPAPLPRDASTRRPCTSP